MHIRVEISVESVAGVRAAEQAGATRVELCAGLSDGGLTPSAGLIEQAVAHGIEVHVLIRPRPGDFRYTPDEVAVMLRDIELARDLGAAGVVVGALDDAGELAPNSAAFVAAAGTTQTTLHRAIDVSADSVRTLDRAMELGFTRVLTSGRRRSALDGAPLIKELAGRAGDALEVMACGGVRADNAVRIVAATGVRDLHAGVRAPVRGLAGGDVSYAGVGVPAGYDHFETDSGGVAALCSLFR